MRTFMIQGFKFKVAGLLALMAAGSALLFQGCEPEVDLPHNPYDDIDYETPAPPVDTLDPLSFAAIYRDILHPRCAVPGCHDGHFEPDMRSVASAHATLAFAPVVKNDTAESFVYRVVPYDTAHSVLHERITNCCFANVNDRMPQDNIGVPLEQEYVDRIAGWIMAGARNMFGEVPTAPDRRPVVFWYWAMDTVASGGVAVSDEDNRIDNVWYNPFIMPYNDWMYMFIRVEDDSTSIENLSPRTLKCSYDIDDLTASAPGYKEYTPSYFYNPWDGSEFHFLPISTAHFAPDKVVYMRYYVSDGTNTTEYPRADQYIGVRTAWSFYILP